MTDSKIVPLIGLPTYLDAQGWLAQRQLSQTTFRDFLKLFDFPPDLRDFGHVVQRILAILDMLEHIVRNEDRDTIAALRRCAELLRDEQTTIAAKFNLRAFPPPTTKARHSLRWSKKHPFYAACWYNAPDHELWDHYCVLLTIFHLTWPRLCRATSADFRFRVGLAIRILGEGSSSNTLRQLPAQPIALIDLPEKFPALFDTTQKNAFLSDRLKIIARAVSIALDMETYERRNSGGRGNPEGGTNTRGTPAGNHFLAPVYADSLDDSSSTFGQFSVLRLKDPNAPNPAPGFRDDVPAPMELFEFYDRDSGTAEFDQTTRTLAAYNQRYAIAKAAQRLAVDGRYCTPFELSVITHDLQHILVETARIRRDLQRPALFLLCCLLLGRPAEEISALRICVTPSPPELNDDHPQLVQHDGYVHVPINHPDVKPQPNENDLDFVLRVRRHLSLPLPNGIADAFALIRRHFTNTEQDTFFRPFVKVTEFARALLMLLAKRHGISISLDKLCRTLQERLVRASGDTALASLATGQFVSTTSNVAYTTVHAESLQQHYRHAIDRMTTEFANELGDDFDHRFWTLAPTIKSPWFVGSALGPGRDYPQALSSALRNRLVPRRGKSPQDNPFEYHNNFITYSVSLLDYGTGHRGTDFHFHGKWSFDIDRNRTLLTDKDLINYFHSRCVPLTTICAQQLVYAIEHRRRVLHRVSIVNPSGARHASQQSLPAASHNRQQMMERARQEVPFFFYLDNTGHILDFTIKRYREHLGNQFPLRPHTCRTYIRSRLIEVGVPGEIIDAGIGHWNYGTAPFAQHSLLAPGDVFRQLIRELEIIQKADGWEALEGFDD